MTKKILAIILAALMVASLAACNNGNNEETTTDGKINITTEGTTAGQTEETTEADTETDAPATNAPAEKDPGELEYSESVGKVYILHANGAVNLRKADGTVFKSFPNGTELQSVAVSKDGAWTKVVYEEKEYYIISSGITTLADLDAGFEEADFTVVVAADSLKIRIAPDYENTHDAIGFYQKNDEVKVVGVNTTNPDEPWYKVEFVAYGGTPMTGYVSAAKKHYVKTETDTTSTDAPTTETTTEAAQ